MIIVNTFAILRMSLWYFPVWSKLPYLYISQLNKTVHEHNYISIENDDYQQHFVLMNYSSVTNASYVWNTGIINTTFSIDTSSGALADCTTDICYVVSRISSYFYLHFLNVTDGGWEYYNMMSYSATLTAFYSVKYISGYLYLLQKYTYSVLIVIDVTSSVVSIDVYAMSDTTITFWDIIALNSTTLQIVGMYGTHGMLLNIGTNNFTTDYRIQQLTEGVNYTLSSTSGSTQVYPYQIDSITNEAGKRWWHCIFCNNYDNVKTAWK